MAQQSWWGSPESRIVVRVARQTRHERARHHCGGTAMAQQSHPAGTPGATGTTGTPDTGWAVGGAAFAGVLLLVNGVLFVLQGISAIATDDVWARVGSYVYKINLTGWGWILLILGVIAIATGAGVLAGAAWARIVGIVLASLSIVAQFLFLPYAPIWSFIMIGLDFFVIWALVTYRPEPTV